MLLDTTHNGGSVLRGRQEVHFPERQTAASAGSKPYEWSGDPTVTILASRWHLFLVVTAQLSPLTSDALFSRPFWFDRI